MEDLVNKLSWLEIFMLGGLGHEAYGATCPNELLRPQIRRASLSTNGAIGWERFGG